jgi:hypothetical protein
MRGRKRSAILGAICLILAGCGQSKSGTAATKARTNANGETLVQVCGALESDFLKTQNDLRKHDATLGLNDIRQLRDDLSTMGAFLTKSQRRPIDQVASEYAAAMRALEDQQSGHVRAAKRELAKAEAIRKSINPADIDRICRG